MRECKVFFAMWAVIFVGQVLISMYGGEFFKLNNLPLDEVLWIAAYTGTVAIFGQVAFALLRRK